MNQEAVFALKFVVKDLAKMRKATEQINKNIEKLSKSAGNASKNVNKLDNSFGKAARSALKFALAYFTVTKIMNSAFAKANEAIQLNAMAISAGVATEKIGKLGKALKQYGGDARSAGAAYASLTNIIGGAQHGMGISEDVARVNAMFGIGFNYGNISQDALMTQIAKAMHRLKKNNDVWGIQQIASAYGLSDDMAAFLSEHGANWKSKVNAEKWKKMNLSEAQRALKAQEDLDEQLKDLSMKLIPLITRLTNAVEKILEYIENWAAKKNPNRKEFDEEGNFVQTGKSNTGVTYNAKTGEYMVFDEKLNPVYQGKNFIKAENEFEKMNYEPTWWDKHVVKPFWNWIGVDTPTIDKGLEAKESKIQIELLNKSGTDLKVGNVTAPTTIK